jgi:hypothetical protein
VQIFFFGSLLDLVVIGATFLWIFKHIVLSIGEAPFVPKCLNLQLVWSGVESCIVPLSSSAVVLLYWREAVRASLSTSALVLILWRRAVRASFPTSPLVLF